MRGLGNSPLKVLALGWCMSIIVRAPGLVRVFLIGFIYNKDLRFYQKGEVFVNNDNIFIGCSYKNEPIMTV